MPTELVTPPAVEPVSLAEARRILRIGHADDDALLAALIGSARRIVEARTGLRLIAQSWAVLRDDWPMTA